MPVLLIAAVPIGYKLWQRHKKRREQERAETDGEPALMVDALPTDAGVEVVTQTGAFMDEQDSSGVTKLDSDLSDDDDQTRSTAATHDERKGPLFGIRKFMEERMDERREREIQRQQQRQFAMKVAQGKIPGAMPKISYK